MEAAENTTRNSVVEYFANKSLDELDAGERLSSLYIAETCLGLIFNSLLVCAIVRGKHTSRQVHIQLINVAVADTLFGAVVCMKAIVALDLLPYVLYPQSEVFCYVATFLYSSLFNSCALWGTAISIERLVLVFYPLKIRRYTRGRRLAVAIVVWITVCLTGVYDVTYTQMVERELVSADGLTLARLFCETEIVLPMALYYSLATTLLPVAIILLMYTLVAYKLCTRKQIGETQRAASTEQNNQIVLMLAVDAVFNTLTTLPSNMFPLAGWISVLNGSSKDFNLVQRLKVLYSISLINCFITPIFYYIFNQAVRADFHMLFSRLFNLKDRDPKSSHSKTTQRTQDRREDTSNKLLSVSSSS